VSIRPPLAHIALYSKRQWATFKVHLQVQSKDQKCTLYLSELCPSCLIWIKSRLSLTKPLGLILSPIMLK